MKRTKGRSRRSRSARQVDPPSQRRRGAHTRRAWFAVSALLIVAVTAAVAVLLLPSDASDSPTAIATSIETSPDMQAHDAGRNVHREARPPDLSPRYTYEWPAPGAITQGMTADHPLGVDIDTGYGAPIYAVRAGTIVTAGGDPCCSYGLRVIVEHPDGWRSLYGHLSGINVSLGETVNQGDVLGFAGDTGKASGTHLHFELRAGRSQVNPLDYLEPYRSYVSTQPLASSSEEEGEESSAIDEPSGVAVSSAVSRDRNPHNASDAVITAIPWLSAQGESTYILNAGTCLALPSGPNWSVHCSVTNIDCSHNPNCPTTVEACVFPTLDLVAARCSGY